MSATFQSDLQAALGDRYLLERELGGGGMSRVFLATESALGRKVVVKVLLPELAAGVNLERFRREIQLAAQLQHPHIVPLLAAGEAHGLPYLIMPYVSGESLRARITREGELPVAETVRILRDVVSALAYAHSHGVVHRDVKPDNVLLSGGVAVVTDFGVAKAVSASSGPAATGLTSHGVALGTPAYMAPEQATASPHTDHRVDIYALGAMAYELLTGLPPFAGRTPQAVMSAHVVEDPEPVERRRAAVPAGLATLVRECLAKSPADRPQTALQVMHVLDSLATPSGGTAATTAVRVSSVTTDANARRHRALLPSAAFMIAILFGGIFWLQREQSARSEITPQKGESASAVAPPAVPKPEKSAAAPSPPLPSPPLPSPPAPRATPKPKPPRAHRSRVDSAKSPVEAETNAAVSTIESLAAAASLKAVADSVALIPETTVPAQPVTTAESAAAPTPASAPATPPPPQPAAAQPAAPTRPADVQLEIRNLVARYARAIEAENLAEIRRVYPGMTSPQQQGWEQFFQLVRNVKADLAVNRVDVANNSADAQVSGTYSYLNTSNSRAERQAVAFRMSLKRDAGQWRISQVH